MTLNQFSYISQPRGFYGTARCERCHRPLTDPESVRLGMGPECRGRSMRGGSGLCRRDEFSDGFDDTISFEQALVLKRRPRAMEREYETPEDGQVVTNVPHLVVHHSPDGYEFGYGGSGPADLALNVCQLYLNMVDYEGQQTRCYDGNCWTLAWALHQKFKQEFIASARRMGEVIPFARIDAWFQSKMTSELIAQYAIQQEV